MNKSFTGKVVQENDEMYLVFDANMLSELGWEDGEIVDWEITDIGVVARKSTMTGE